MAPIAWEDFERVDMRVGEIVQAEEFPEARNPSYRLRVDFGPLGLKKCSAAIKKWYARRDLVGRQVVAVVNFPPKQIANFLSEVLVLGAIEEDGRVVLLEPRGQATPGSRVA